MYYILRASKLWRGYGLSRQDMKHPNEPPHGSLRGGPRGGGNRSNRSALSLAAPLLILPSSLSSFYIYIPLPDMSTPSCQTCYSTIRPAQLPGAYLTPCCGLPICDRCLGLNPRLREYDPCLRCGDVRSASGSSRVRIGAAAQRAEDRR